MLIYVLIGLLFVLLGVAGLQFTYLFYFDRIDRERKKHIHDLERRCLHLGDKLDAAERRVLEQDRIIADMHIGSSVDGEAWADVIEDR